MTKHGISEEGIDFVKKENGDMVLTKNCIKDKVKEMENSIYFFHSDVCYLLNFGELGQERASEMSDHYNALMDILNEYLEEDHGAEPTKAVPEKKKISAEEGLAALVKGLAEAIEADKGEKE